jgi:lysophospholipase L1-like esterase
MGWGQPLGELFAPECATVKDMAISGRSTKSFYEEGAWNPVKDALQSGDYVLIQFGHNDEKSEDPKRYTDPQTSYKAFLTMFVMDTRQKLATPILLTPINRNKWNGGTLADTHGAYPGAMRELAQAIGVELVDLTALSKAYFERLGEAETSKLFMNLNAGQSPNYPSGSSDDTHLQESGARLIARLAMADVSTRTLGLAKYFAGAPVAP